MPAVWPKWLADDIEGLAVWLVEYEAPVARWRGTAMHLTDRASNVLHSILVNPSLQQGQLTLVGHSLGGLLIKQMLRIGEAEAHRNAEAASFMDRVRKVAFLATPHTGVDLASLGDRLRILVRASAATISLVRNDPNLRDLNQWYREWARRREIDHLILTETKTLPVLGMIVKPDSGDPGLSSPPVPIDGNHIRADWPDDLCEIVYIDHYGNAMTGLRAAVLPPNARLATADRVVERPRTFSDLPTGAAFWYENSNGLAEIAVNQGRADHNLGLSIGIPVAIVS
jgi:pimeloyl-ACP methyl ester carboxylesterase